MKYLKSMIVRIFQMIEYPNRFFYLFFIIYTFTIYNTIEILLSSLQFCSLNKIHLNDKMNSNNKY